jgi:5-methylcytosine-specific restriction endonuclease McrA
MTNRNANSLAWYHANKERILAYKKEYYQKTKEKRLATSSEYRKNNRQKVSEINKEWRLKNTAAINAKNRTRRASKNHRTPAWLTDIDYERIQNEYKLAYILSKITGEKWEVDHVIPLHGETVSGLHVPSNLKAIPAIANRAKHNRYEAIK